MILDGCLSGCPSVRPAVYMFPDKSGKWQLLPPLPNATAQLLAQLAIRPLAHTIHEHFQKKVPLFFLAENEKYIFQVGPQFQSFRSLANFPSKWWFCWLCVCVCPCYFCVDMFAFWQVIYGKQQYTISGRDHSNVLLTSRREGTFVCLPPWMTCHCGSLTATAVAIC